MLNHCYWDEMIVKYQDLQIFVLYISTFHPLEIVGRGRETQLQVGENSVLYLSLLSLYLSYLMFIFAQGHALRAP